MILFHDRADAGRQLADRLARAGLSQASTILLGIPRGGVIVAAEVARILKLPLDVLITKKIGAPNNPEYAIGAVGPDGAPMWNPAAAALFTASERQQALQAARAKVRAYQIQFGSPRLAGLAGQTVVVIDDGIATGQSLQPGLTWLRRQNPKQLVLAVPVAPRAARETLGRLVDRYIALQELEFLAAIGQFYETFGDVPDREVAALLKQYRWNQQKNSGDSPEHGA